MSEDSELIQRQRRDFEDLNNEIAGREVGRQARFLNEDARSPEAERKKREERAFQNRLMEMLNDPIYRAKHKAAMTALQDAERATDAAFAQLQSDILATQDTIRDMEDRAARLPDGTRVFKDAEGIVRHADGTVVDDDLTATILWTGDEPSFEDYQAQHAKLAALEAQHRDVEDYQNGVLGSARDRLTDPDDPPTLDQLDDIIDGIQTKMPDVVAAQTPAETPSIAQPADPTSIPLPDFSGEP